MLKASDYQIFLSNEDESSNSYEIKNKKEIKMFGEKGLF